MNIGYVTTSQSPGILIDALQLYYSFENPNCWLPWQRRVTDLTGNSTGSLRNVASMSYDINKSALSSSGGLVLNRGITISCSLDVVAYSSGSTYCFWANYAPNATGVASVVFLAGAALVKGRVSLVTASNGHTGILLENSYLGSNVYGDADTNGWHFWTATLQNGGLTKSLALDYPACTCSVYRDGQLLNTFIGYETGAGSSQVQIGYNAAASGFRGLINGVWMYKRALTDAEVLYNFNATKWRFGL